MMPSDTGQIVLGIDLDGVCADFYSRMREIAAEWFERDIDSLSTEVSYGLEEWGVREGTDDYQSLHRFAVTQRNLFETTPMIPGARSVLRKLSNEGYRIRIITHRLYIHFFHETSVRQTIQWLDNNGIPYWDLCFMKEKDQVGADVYVEDAPVNLKRLRERGHYAICFANSTNRDVSEPRASNWDEVYALIKQKYPNSAK
jgi:5'(3')-deoxyribonucleotidase